MYIIVRDSGSFVFFSNGTPSRVARRSIRYGLYLPVVLLHIAVNNRLKEKSGLAASFA